MRYMDREKFVEYLKFAGYTVMCMIGAIVLGFVFTLLVLGIAVFSELLAVLFVGILFLCYFLYALYAIDQL